MPWPGQRLKSNRYELLALLRRGGAGAVWRGVDLREGREVALKALPLDGGGQGAMEHEAEAALRVAHPHALASTDTFVDVEHAWLAMELCAGSVADVLEEGGPWSPVEAIDALRGPLAALAAAHASGVVHRDVKPSNLLVRGDGTVLLADFGIARMLADARAQTRSAALLGSLPYMAPEQRRDARDVRPATDVYAAAATLATMLCGAPVGDLYMPGAGLRLHAARVPEPLQEVILRAGGWAPEERYPDAASLLVALEGLALLGAGGAAPRNAPRVPTWIDAPAAAENNAGVSGEASVRAVGGASPQRAAAVGAAGWAVATGVLALLAGVVAGAWVALRDDVRGVLVDEPEEVHRAREMAAIPVCEDGPSSFTTLVYPASSREESGTPEAGGGRILRYREGGGKVLFGAQLGAGFDLFSLAAGSRFVRASRTSALRMTMDAFNATTAGDLDADGYLDLVGVAPESSGVVISWGGGDGTGGAVLEETVANAREVVLMDMDQDRLLDVITLSMHLGRSTLQWQRNRGRKLERHREILSGVRHVDAAVVDGNPTLFVLDLDGALRALVFDDTRGILGDQYPKFVPMNEPVGVRVVEDPTGDVKDQHVVVWDRNVAVRYRLRENNFNDACVFRLPPYEVADIGFLNDDSVLDAVSVLTCSYCTSSYMAFLGVLPLTPAAARF